MSPTGVPAVLSLLALLGLGAVSNAQCPAPSPCLCSSDIIECRGHDLPLIPQLRYVGKYYRSFRFGVNNFTSIRESAFSSLNVSEIYLDFNYISIVNDKAFSGMRTTLKVLDLSHNRLKNLPDAIGTLDNLAELDVSYNPMDGYQTSGHSHTDGFTDYIMTLIGDSLIKFTFGDDFMLHWPKSLHHLVQLKELYLAGSGMNYLNPAASHGYGAFHGFEHTIRKLSLTHSRFVQLPLDISTLDKLEELHFDHNRVTDGDSVIIPQPLTAINKTLTVLSLRYDHLKVVPEVLQHLHMLTNISLDGNPLEFISDEAISFIQHTHVRILSFRDCDLTRLPGSLSNIANLVELDFSMNKIKTIEIFDLNYIPHLKTLTLAKNPLEFIARDSFMGLGETTLLDMSYTDITEVPQSIANMFKLKVVDFSHARIDCTCDMFWVRRLMDFVNITFRGECETIDRDIQSYVMGRVPSCPDYQEYFVG